MSTREYADKTFYLARNEKKDLISAGASSVWARRTQAYVQTRIEELYVDMLQLGNSADLDGLKTASVRFCKTVIAQLFRRECAEYLWPEFRHRWIAEWNGTNSWMLMCSRSCSTWPPYDLWPDSSREPLIFASTNVTSLCFKPYPET